MSDNERFERGKKVRAAVLGSAHVARTANNRTPFNALGYVQNAALLRCDKSTLRHREGFPSGAVL